MPNDWLFVRLPKRDGGRAVERPVAEPVQAAPASDDPPSAWAEAVCAASDKALATEWMRRVDGEDLLAEVATRSRFAEIRLAAARRITDTGVLRRVAEASKEKDKHVYRHCTDVLKASRQEGVRARRAPELSAALRTLLDATPVAISHLLLIEKDLASLGKGGDETAECEALLEQARERVLQETQAQIEMRGLLASAEALLISVRTAIDPTADQLGEWSAQHSTLVEAASAAPPWLRTIPAARNFVGVLEEVENRVHAFGEALGRMVAEEDRRAAEVEATHAAEVQARLAAESATQPKKKFDHDAVSKLLGELESHLEEGRIVEAEASLKAVDRILGGAAPSGQVARRLQRARAHQTRLAGWARWGTDKAREQLIEVAEALLQGEPDIAERARAVPLLRREWKNLDAHGGAPQALWKKFDRALERAYKPVAEQRAVEAAAHEAARAAKAALLDGWEAWYAEQATPDLKVLDAKREEMTGKWRSAARAGFREERQLRKRFDTLMGKIDAQLEEGRTKEVTRLRDLVTHAEALKDTADLAAAMSAAKTLQRRWKEDVPAIRLRHGEDQKLWRRFRTACDAVFARRDAEQVERDAQRAKRDEERRAEIEAARLVEQKKKEKHAARFAEMAQKAAPVADAPVDALEKGKAERDALLLDLEIALDLPTPEAYTIARRTRNLTRLQERFSKGAATTQDPEAMVAKWYAIPAAADEAQSARLAAVVERLLNQKPQARSASFPSRKDSRS